MDQRGPEEKKRRRREEKRVNSPFAEGTKLSIFSMVGKTFDLMVPLTLMLLMVESVRSRLGKVVVDGEKRSACDSFFCQARKVLARCAVRPGFASKKARRQAGLSSGREIKRIEEGKA